MSVIAWLRQLSSRPNADHVKFFKKLMKTRRLAVILAALLSALVFGTQTHANSPQSEKLHLLMGLAYQSVQRPEVAKNGGPEAMADKQHTSGCHERLAPTKAEHEGYSCATLS
jgi:hypothetical protein